MVQMQMGRNKYIPPKDDLSNFLFNECKVKYLRLQIHHLSYFMIYLLRTKYDEPCRIDIRYHMSNFIDSPACHITPKAYHLNNICLDKWYDKRDPTKLHIRYFESCNYNFMAHRMGNAQVCNKIIDVQTFDNAFNDLEKNIDTILEANTQKEEAKRLKKSNKVPIDRRAHKSFIKHIDHVKSESKKKIREVIIRLYS